MKLSCNSLVVLALACFVSLVGATATFSINAGTATASQYTIIGTSYVDSSKNTFVTTNAQPRQAGAIWINQPIKLAAGFNITTKFRITQNPSDTSSGCRINTANADGFAFVLNAANLSAIGTPGEFIGYNFENNFAIELDTYYNNGQNDPIDINYHVFHVGAQSCGSSTNSPDHKGPCALANPVLITTCYDNVDHILNLYYDAITHNITVSYDGVQILAFTYNIAAHLNLINGDSVYVGFTGSTGTQYSRQEFYGFDYTDLQQFSCQPPQLANYTDNTCYSCPSGYYANYTINRCLPNPSACSSAAITVSNSDDLQAALFTHCNIVLNAGTYGAPTNKQGFQITMNGTRITANQGATISCGSGAGSLTTVVDNANHATQLAIGLYVAPSVVNVFVQNVTFQNCQTGVYADFYSESTFDTVTVTNNFNNVGIGSGFHTIVTSNVTITNSNIYGNIGYAGLLILGSANVQQTTVNGNSGGAYATRYGGSIYINGGTLNNNYGSGIYAERNSYVNAQNVQIANNYGSYFGGGVWSRNSNIVLRNVAIISNTARTGGGIYGELSSSYDLTNVVVQQNTAGSINNAYFSDDTPVKQSGTNIGAN